MISQSAISKPETRWAGLRVWRRSVAQEKHCHGSVVRYSSKEPFNAVVRRLDPAQARYIPTVWTNCPRKPTLSFVLLQKRG